MPFRRTGSVDWANQPTPTLLEQMLFQSQGAYAPGNYIAPNTWNATGAIAPQSVNRQNMIFVTQAGTLKALEIDSSSAAGDSSEKFTVIKNGTATTVVATIVNGTTRGTISGQSVAVAAGDSLSILYDAGASGAVGRVSTSLRMDLIP